MNPIASFDPNLPCEVRDRVNDKMFDWRTGNASTGNMPSSIATASRGSTG
jgi:hypothetical protein